MDEVSEDEGWGPALTLDRLHKNSSVLNSLVNESIRYAEVLLGILTNFILHRYIKVFEILAALCVLLATRIQYVCNALLNQLLGFKRRLERSHINPGIDLEQIDLLERDSTVYLASAD